MNTEEYKQKLLISVIPNTFYAIDVLSQTEWYLAQEEDRKVFKEKLMPLLEDNIDSLDKNGLEKIVSAITSSAEYKKETLIKLMDKSIQFQTALITPYHSEFDIFTEEQKVNYIELLNQRNYHDFWYLDMKLSNGETGRLTGKALVKFYEKNYFSDGQEIINKFIPKDNLNLFIINNQPDLFFNNMIFTKEYKEDLFQKYLEKSTSIEDLFHIVRFIRGDRSKVDLSNCNLLEPLINRIGLDKNEQYGKKGILRLSSLFMESELTQKGVKIILNSPELKAGYLSILKKKIRLPNDYDIPSFKNPLEDYTNLNLLQYLMFSSSNKFVMELCKKDKDFMNAFNNCIHHNVHGFNYEKSPLDLALNGIIKPEVIEEIYISKIINHEIKDSIKDKVCAFFFKSIIECNTNYKTRYANLLNAVSCMPSNLFNRYMNYYKNTLDSMYTSDRHDKKKDLKTIQNMLEVKHSLPKSEEIKSRKLKI